MTNSLIYKTGLRPSFVPAKFVATKNYSFNTFAILKVYVVMKPFKA